MPAEVKFTMSASNHATLRAVLKYVAGQTTKEQFASTLATLGYKPPITDEQIERQLKYLAEQMAAAIE